MHKPTTSNIAIRALYFRNRCASSLALLDLSKLVPHNKKANAATRMPLLRTIPPGEEMLLLFQNPAPFCCVPYSSISVCCKGAWEGIPVLAMANRSQPVQFVVTADYQLAIFRGCPANRTKQSLVA